MAGRKMPSFVTRASKPNLPFATLFTCFLVILNISSSESIDGANEGLSAAVKMAIQCFRNTSLYRRLSPHLQMYGWYDFQAAYSAVLIGNQVQLDIGWPEKALVVGPKDRSRVTVEKDAKISGQIFRARNVIRSFPWRKIIVIHDTQSADSKTVHLLYDSLQNAGLEMEYRFVFPTGFTHRRVGMSQTNFSGVFIILPSRLLLANLSSTHRSPWSPAQMHTFLEERFSQSRTSYTIQSKCNQQFFEPFQQRFPLDFPEEDISETGSYVIQVYNNSIITLPWTMEQTVDNFISLRISHDTAKERELTTRDSIDLSGKAGFKKDIRQLIQSSTLTGGFSSALFHKSGLSLVVPLNPESTRTWMFLKPFTRSMWLATVAVLIYTMFMVWFIEHRCNPDLSSVWTEQLGNAVWFTFCTLFFVQREGLRSSYARMIVLMWLFVVLVVTQSYTSVLTSMLTTSTSQPMVRDTEQLKGTNATIGYIGDSALRNYLENVLKFDAKNIKSIGNSLDLLMEFESSNITAAFVTISNARAFVEHLDKKYTIVSTYRFGEPDSVSCECFDSQTTSASSSVSLSLQNFQDLYLVYISASTFCLLLFVLQLLVKNWQLISNSTPVRNTVMWLLAHVKTVWHKAAKLNHQLVPGVWKRALCCY